MIVLESSVNNKVTGNFLATVTLVSFRNFSMTVAPVFKYNLALGEEIV